jgi:DNA polymerase III subunit delta
VKASKDQIERALDAPPSDIRLFLLYGPDEAGSRALAARLERAMGSDAERIDLDGVTLKADPARLTDEAASISLFGDKRWIRLAPLGEEGLAAVEALLEADAAGNPVVAIMGAIKASSPILKRALADKAALAFVSYPPEAGDAIKIASTLAREHGLRIENDLARRIAQSAGNDRAVMAREIEKLALYLDAAPDRPAEADASALDAIGAGEGEGELSRLVDAVLDGSAALVCAEIARLAADGAEGIPLLRALSKRLQLLVRMGADVADGRSVNAVVEGAGKAIFWKEKAPITRQLSRWTPARLAIAADHVIEAERAIKSVASPGIIMADAALITIARAAGRVR